MKILVPLKRVPDSDTRIRLKSDGTDIETDGVKYAVNPFDAIALEEALRLREAGRDCEIVVVSVGATDVTEQLRTGLAMGADRAVWVQVGASLDSLAVAKVLAAICGREKPDAVLLGKQAIDDDSNQVGQMLAALLGVAQATFVSRLQFVAHGVQIRCARETDAGIETIDVRLPAVITTDLRLNEPRYVSLPGIMKAKRKPIEECTLTDLGIDVVSRTQVLRLELPPARQAGVRVRTVDELISQLRHAAKII